MSEPSSFIFDLRSEPIIATDRALTKLTERLRDLRFYTWTRTSKCIQCNANIAYSKQYCRDCADKYNFKQQTIKKSLRT